MLICSLVIVGAGCGQKRTVDRAFYYWKTILDASPKERETLQSLQVKKLYLKFFDVVWNPVAHRPDPSEKLEITPDALEWLKQDSMEIIPSIFISNDCLQQISPMAVDELGERINYLLAGMLNLDGIYAVKEIQIDCDWSEATREKYFALLRYLKALPLFISAQLTTTVRLHQCLNQEKLGIPPVNRGLLLCYNMGNLKSIETGNSILDAENLKPYTAYIGRYPLPLDLALPLYEWKVLFRNNSFTGLIQNLPDDRLDNPVLVQKEGNQSVILKDTLLYGYELKKGDVIRTEKSRYEEIIGATKLLSPILKSPRFTVTLFHLDARVLAQFNTDQLRDIYQSLEEKKQKSE